MRPSINLIIDIIAAVAYLIVANPLITGWVIHEWLGIGIVFVFIVHCATHFDWVAGAFKKRASTGSKANLALDIATLIAFLVVTVSGLMVSRIVLPLFGYVAVGYFFWNPLHSISAKVLFALLLMHVVVHWRWFASLFQRKKKETGPKLEEESRQQDKQERQ